MGVISVALKICVALSEIVNYVEYGQRNAQEGAHYNAVIKLQQSLEIEFDFVAGFYIPLDSAMHLMRS